MRERMDDPSYERSGRANRPIWVDERRTYVDVEKITVKQAVVFDQSHAKVSEESCLDKWGTIERFGVWPPLTKKETGRRRMLELLRTVFVFYIAFQRKIKAAFPWHIDIYSVLQVLYIILAFRRCLYS